MKATKITAVFVMVAAALHYSHSDSHAQVLLWDSSGVAICTAEGWQRLPRIVTDGSGGAIIAWEDMRAAGSRTAVYASRILPDASLPWKKDGVEIAPPAQGLRLAGLVEDGAGGAFLAWWSDAAGHSDVFAHRIDAQGRFVWNHGPIPVCTAPGNQQWAEMISDGEGGIIITWHDARGQDNDIYAQRIDADGNVLWQRDGVAVSTAPGDQSFPQLASNRHGGAYIAWMDRRDEDDIYMQHVLDDGSRRWNEDLPVCIEVNRQIAPKVGQFGDDKVIVFWQDFRQGPTMSALYLQIFDEDGNRTYSEDYEVTQSDKAQSGMSLTDDGQGGSLAIWADFRKSATNGDIYMRRINADGSVIGDFGNALCDAADTQERPRMINDGFGGGLAVWQDRRNAFDYDIYMNRVSSVGTTIYDGWNRQSGVLLHKHDNNQLAPQLVASTTGTAIVVWYDGRVMDGQADIYAQRVAWAPNLLRPDSIHFGTQKAGMYLYDTLTIRNNGARPLVITNVRRASDPGTTHPTDFISYPSIPLPYTLEVDSTATLVVGFKPTGLGLRYSELRISSNAPEDPAIIPLTGFGTNPRIETPSVYQITVTKVGRMYEEEVRDFISNSGSGTLYIHRAEFGGRDSSLFSWGANPPFPLAIPEDQSIAVRLRFAPDSVGPRESILRLYHNADTLPRNIRIAGIGAVPNLLTNPISMYFDTTEATKQRETSIQIRNTSGVELVVTGLQLDGPDASEFSIRASPPILVPGNASEPFFLRFEPRSPGAKRADVIITSDAPSSPDVVRVYGAAVPLDATHPSQAGEFALLSLYPNPASVTQGMTAELRTPYASSGTLRLRFIDVLGREAAAWEADTAPGEIISLPMHFRPGQLTPGVYALIAETSISGVLRRIIRPVLLLP
jgi:hypothetical protein